MIKQLIIHLGDRKTGSTSIQTALCKEVWQCETAAIHYPANFNHNYLAGLIKNNEQDALKTHVGKLRQKLIRSNAHYAIISAEGFEAVPPDSLSRFIHQYMSEWKDSIKLIAYIRPHANRFVSSFVERRKLGVFNQSMSVLHQRFKENRFLIYKERLDTWRSTFGDSFKVRPFVRSLLHNNDVVDDFFEQVFIGHEYSLKRLDYRNESLCLEDLSTLVETRKFIKHKYGNQLNRKALLQLGQRLAMQFSASEAKGTRICVHRELAKEMKSFYYEDAQAIDNEYFSEEPFASSLNSIFDNVVEDEQSLNIHDHFSDQEVRRLHCLADLIGSMISNNPQHLINSNKDMRQT